VVQVHDDAVEVVGPTRAVRAAFVPLRGEHEVIDDQLAAAVEELRQRPLAVPSFEHVRLLDALPGQRAAFLTQPVPLACEFFLQAQEGVAGFEPFLVRDDLGSFHTVPPQFGACDPWSAGNSTIFNH
jgi:hypothetical protein